LNAAETIKRDFFQELLNASDGKATSLRFIKHELHSEKLISDGEIFQVFVVGGTVFRKALLKKDREQFIILDDFSEEHPSLTSKEMFLEYISKHLYPNSDTAVINFAFPLEPQAREGRLDGKLLTETKETPFKGLMGEFIGLSIEQYAYLQLRRTINVHVINDAICLFLSETNKTHLDFTAGAIIGTGTNISFSHHGFAVNLESGGFNKFTPSSECLEIDKKSDQKGVSLFEKETAGGYLYKHFNYYLDKSQLTHKPISSTKELQAIALDNKNPRAQILASSLLEKSAAYFAGLIAGLTAFKNHNMTFIIEGSMYWENDLYRKFVDDYLDKLSPDLKIKIIKVDNSPIIGAARLIA
jgi:hexokinase